jgi:hypothetical protein
LAAGDTAFLALTWRSKEPYLAPSGSAVSCSHWLLGEKRSMRAKSASRTSKPCNTGAFTRACVAREL